MLNHEELFHQAILREPQDQSHWNAYADWLDEQGRDAAAEGARRLAAQSQHLFSAVHVPLPAVNRGGFLHYPITHEERGALYDLYGHGWNAFSRYLEPHFQDLLLKPEGLEPARQLGTEAVPHLALSLPFHDGSAQIGLSDQAKSLPHLHFWGAGATHERLTGRNFIVSTANPAHLVEEAARFLPPVKIAAQFSRSGPIRHAATPLEDIFHKAIWSNPNDASHWNAYADWLREQGHDDAAEGALRLAQQAHRLSSAWKAALPAQLNAQGHLAPTSATHQGLWQQAFGVRHPALLTHGQPDPRAFEALFEEHHVAALSAAGLPLERHLTLSLPAVGGQHLQANHQARMTPDADFWAHRYVGGGFRNEHGMILSHASPRRLAEEAANWLPRQDPTRLQRHRFARGDAEEQSFWNGLAENPRDQAPHLIYADWLEEQGHEQEAHYQRRYANEFLPVAQPPLQSLTQWAHDWTFNQERRGEFAHLVRAYGVGHPLLARLTPLLSRLQPTTEGEGMGEVRGSYHFFDNHGTARVMPALSVMVSHDHTQPERLPLVRLTLDDGGRQQATVHYQTDHQTARDLAFHLRALHQVDQERAKARGDSWRASQHRHSAHALNEVGELLDQHLAHHGGPPERFAAWPDTMTQYEQPQHSEVKPLFPLGMIPYAHSQLPAEPATRTTRARLLAALRRGQVPVAAAAPDAGPVAGVAQPLVFHPQTGELLPVAQELPPLPQKNKLILTRDRVKAAIRCAVPRDPVPYTTAWREQLATHLTSFGQHGLAQLIQTFPTYRPEAHGDGSGFSQNREAHQVSNRQFLRTGLSLKYLGKPQYADNEMYLLHLSNQHRARDGEPIWHQHYLVNREQARKVWEEFEPVSTPEPRREQHMGVFARHERNNLLASLGLYLRQFPDSYQGGGGMLEQLRPHDYAPLHRSDSNQYNPNLNQEEVKTKPNHKLDRPATPERFAQPNHAALWDEFHHIFDQEQTKAQLTGETPPVNNQLFLAHYLRQLGDPRAKIIADAVQHPLSGHDYEAPRTLPGSQHYFYQPVDDNSSLSLAFHQHRSDPALNRYSVVWHKERPHPEQPTRSQQITFRVPLTRDQVPAYVQDLDPYVRDGVLGALHNFPEPTTPTRPQKLSARAYVRQAIRLEQDMKAPAETGDHTESKPEGCTCNYPIQKLRNGSGHGRDKDGKPCPKHKEYLSKNVWGKKKGETKERRSISWLHQEWNLNDGPSEGEGGGEAMQRDATAVRLNREHLPALHAAISEAPEDNARWLIAADALEEAGKSHTGDFFRKIAAMPHSRRPWGRVAKRYRHAGLEDSNAAFTELDAAAPHYSTSLEGTIAGIPLELRRIVHRNTGESGGMWHQVVVGTTNEHGQPTPNEGPAADIHVSQEQLAHLASELDENPADWDPERQTKFRALLQNKPAAEQPRSQMQRPVKAMRGGEEEQSIAHLPEHESTPLPHTLTRAAFSQQPGTVFHGTNAADFSHFDPVQKGTARDVGWLGSGFYFSTDRTGMAKGAKTLIPAQVGLQNPFRFSLPNFGRNKNLHLNELLQTKGLIGESLTAELRRRGHDGVILDYSPTGYNHQEVLAFDPTAITTHRAAVEQALKQGHAVSAEVLADYPDLQPQPHQMSLRTRFRQAVQMAAQKDRPVSIQGAQGRIDSGNHYTLLNTLRDILNRSGLSPNKVYPAIHDVGGNARAAALAEILGMKNDQSGAYGTAWQGLIAHLPELVLFRSHPQGKDSVYRMGFKGPQQAMSQLLDKIGVQSRVFVPHKEGSQVYVYDRGRGLRQPLGDLASSMELEVVEHTGDGEFHGGGDDMGRGAYRDTINANESSQRTPQQFQRDDSQGALFHLALAANPHDRATWLAAADHHSEQGRPFTAHALKTLGEMGDPLDLGTANQPYMHARHPEAFTGKAHSYLTGSIRGSTEGLPLEIYAQTYGEPSTNWARIYFGDYATLDAPTWLAHGLASEIDAANADGWRTQRAWGKAPEATAHGVHLNRHGAPVRLMHELPAFGNQVQATPDDYAPKFAALDYLRDHGHDLLAEAAERGIKLNRGTDWRYYPGHGMQPGFAAFTTRIGDPALGAKRATLRIVRWHAQQPDRYMHQVRIKLPSDRGSIPLTDFLTHDHDFVHRLLTEIPHGEVGYGSTFSRSAMKKFLEQNGHGQKPQQLQRPRRPVRCEIDDPHWHQPWGDAIHENPEDRAHHLIYADALEEQGDPRHQIVRDTVAHNDSGIGYGWGQAIGQHGGPPTYPDGSYLFLNHGYVLHPGEHYGVLQGRTPTHVIVSWLHPDGSPHFMSYVPRHQIHDYLADFHPAVRDKLYAQLAQEQIKPRPPREIREMQEFSRDGTPIRCGPEDIAPLHAAVAENNQDDARWLILADALEENNSPATAAWFRQLVQSPHATKWFSRGRVRRGNRLEALGVEHSERLHTSAYNFGPVHEGTVHGIPLHLQQITREGPNRQPLLGPYYEAHVFEPAPGGDALVHQFNLPLEHGQQILQEFDPNAARPESFAKTPSEQGSDYYGTTPTEEWLKPKHYRGRPAPEQEEEGLGSGWVPVRSTWIAGLRRTVRSRIVEMLTKKGKKYGYELPKGALPAWLNATSKGKWWWAHVHGNQLQRQGAAVQLANPQIVSQLHAGLSEDPHDTGRWNALADAVRENGYDGWAYLLQMIGMGQDKGQTGLQATRYKWTENPSIRPAALRQRHHVELQLGTLRTWVMPLYHPETKQLVGGQFQVPHEDANHNGAAGYAILPTSDLRVIMHEAHPELLRPTASPTANQEHRERFDNLMHDLYPERQEPVAKLQRAVHFMQDTPAFGRKIREGGFLDRAPKLVYADYVEEQGYPHLAAVLRRANGQATPNEVDLSKIHPSYIDGEFGAPTGYGLLETTRGFVGPTEEHKPRPYYDHSGLPLVSVFAYHQNEKQLPVRRYHITVSLPTKTVEEAKDGEGWSSVHGARLMTYDHALVRGLLQEMQPEEQPARAQIRQYLRRKIGGAIRRSQKKLQRSAPPVRCASPEEIQQLHNALAENPHDEARWGILADAVEEHGHSGIAHLLRTMGGGENVSNAQANQAIHKVARGPGYENSYQFHQGHPLTFQYGGLGVTATPLSHRASPTGQTGLAGVAFEVPHWHNGWFRGGTAYLSPEEARHILSDTHAEHLLSWSETQHQEQQERWASLQHELGLTPT